MLPSNTSEILKNLSKNEIKKLGDFVQSPYFNSKETLYSLFKEIEKNYPSLKDEKFEYKKIYKKIYGDKEYKEQTIKNLYSEFGALLKKFIVHERIESDKLSYDIALVRGLNDKNCYEQSSKTILALKKESEEKSIFEDLRFLYLYNLECCHNDNLLSSNNLTLDQYHKVYNSILDNATYFFIGLVYSMKHEALIINKAHNVSEKTRYASEGFMENFNSEKFLNSLPDEKFTGILKFYYYSYKYIEADISEEEYREYKKLLIDNIKKINATDKISAWGSILTVIIIKLIPKDKKYYEEAFEINEYFISMNLYQTSPNINLAISKFRDVFGVGLVLRNFEWTKKFIDDYTIFLPKESKENEFNYAMGRLSFQLKNYEESLMHLNKVKFQQVVEKLNVRFYYLMNYIELKSYQAAVSMLSSIRQFYSESKEIPEMFAVLIESALKYFREIIKAEENNKKIDYSVLKEAENAGRYYHKQYILEKLKILTK